ncbi:hypothetical protein LEP1GSC161_2821 [Leptospira santarosai str. CBC1416]|uniref:Uncharacterized protein n=1 Tax=Leptospira santarosai str. CBC1416 TaxID=1193059 RepID=M6W149_9LEPT|nr:hypothetical protein LEP1GSC161_2821 [Leptospira santarosai str. CBC1416]
MHPEIRGTKVSNVFSVFMDFIGKIVSTGLKKTAFNFAHKNSVVEDKRLCCGDISLTKDKIANSYLT